MPEGTSRLCPGPRPAYHGVSGTGLPAAPVCAGVQHTPGHPRRTPGPAGAAVGWTCICDGRFIKRLLMSAAQRGEGAGRGLRRRALVKTCNERQNKSPISGKAVVKSLNDSGVFSGVRGGP